MTDVRGWEQRGDTWVPPSLSRVGGHPHEDLSALIDEHLVRLYAVEYDVVVLQDDSGWMSLTSYLQNSWVSYDNNYGPPRFRKKGGIVYVQGLIKNGTLGTVVANLPAGFRPSLPVVLFTTQGENNVINRYDMYSNGNLVNAGGASNAWSSLNGITFPADA